VLGPDFRARVSIRVSTDRHASLKSDELLSRKICMWSASERCLV